VDEGELEPQGAGLGLRFGGKLASGQRRTIEHASMRQMRIVDGGSLPGRR
jgi:hypothetical protein